MPPQSRRERNRQETYAQIKSIASVQIAAYGAPGLSLNAIAKELGMTGPALYRYFDNREALLTELIMDAYSDLASAVELAATRSAKRPATSRLRDMANAFRGWALHEPHRYLLLFGTPVPGYAAPAGTVVAANRSLAAFAKVIAGLHESRPVGRGALERQLSALSAERGMDVHPHALHLAFRGWIRLHGFVSLEVEGQFEATGVDPQLLFRAELDALIADFAR